MEQHGWELKRLLTFTRNRLANRPHRPRDAILRTYMKDLGFEWPEPEGPEGDEESSGFDETEEDEEETDDEELEEEEEEKKENEGEEHKTNHAESMEGTGVRKETLENQKEGGDIKAGGEGTLSVSS